MSISVPCLLFSFSFFCGAGVILSRGLYWLIPGVAVGVLCAAYLLTCWSASPQQVWSWHLVAQEHSCFLNVMWCGETLYWMGVWGVGVLLSLGVLFSAKCGSSICKIFDLQSSRCLLPPSSHHFGPSSVPF
jgi:hypothetical protein